MGSVFGAYDRQRGEQVALKVLLDPSDEQRARFLQEAASLEALDHPGIVRHYAHGVTEEGHVYLAMEWLSGEDLGALLSRGPLRVEAALTLLARLAEIVAFVHARGVVHRDLKPA